MYSIVGAVSLLRGTTQRRARSPLRLPFAHDAACLLEPERSKQQTGCVVVLFIVLYVICLSKQHTCATKQQNDSSRTQHIRTSKLFVCPPSSLTVPPRHQHVQGLLYTISDLAMAEVMLRHSADTGILLVEHLRMQRDYAITILIYDSGI